MGCASFGGAGSPLAHVADAYLRIPSGILIHPAVWAQQTWVENWRLHRCYRALAARETPVSGAAA